MEYAQASHTSSITSPVSRDGSDPESERTIGERSPMPAKSDVSDAAAHHQEAEKEEEPCMCIETRNARRERGWRKVVRNFTPSWFSVNMGTGIVSILLHNLPYNAVWLYWLSVVIFCLNVVLFTIFLCLSIARYTIYPEIWPAMIRHPAQSLFLGTFPMGLATIINMTVFVCVPSWGYRAVQLVGYYYPMYLHETALSKMTAAWLLPIVAPIVAAASGGIVAEVLENSQHALWTVIASYVLWGTGVPLAMVVLVMYFQRLTLHKLPPREVIVSVFLPLGPLGQGGYGIMQLGKVAMELFPKTHTLAMPHSVVNSGEVLYVGGWLMATIMWGFGLVWMFFAAASITRAKFPFNMGWWGFTFPLGVFTASTTQIGKELPSTFFDVFGTITSLAVTLFWIVVTTRTLHQTYTGVIFVDPCIKDLKEKHSCADNTNLMDNPGILSV